MRDDIFSKINEMNLLYYC